VTDQNEIEQRLLRLSQQTGALRPSAGFSARVMFAIEREARPNFFESTWSSALRLLPVAAVAAAMALIWAVQVDGSVDDALATSYAAMDLE
jgi:hypothetical protein